MATSGLIIVTDNHSTFYIYSHYDSGPADIERHYKAAKKRAWPKERWCAGDFACALISVMRDDKPGGVYLEVNHQVSADYTYLITRDGLCRRIDKA